MAKKRRSILSDLHSQLVNKPLHLLQGGTDIPLGYSTLYNKGIPLYKVKGSDLLTHTSIVLQRGVVSDRIIKKRI
jgi:hypothetical protein